MEPLKGKFKPYELRIRVLGEVGHIVSKFKAGMFDDENLFSKIKADDGSITIQAKTAEASKILKAEEKKASKLKDPLSSPSVESAPPPDGKLVDKVSSPKAETPEGATTDAPAKPKRQPRLTDPSVPKEPKSARKTPTTPTDAVPAMPDADISAPTTPVAAPVKTKRKGRLNEDKTLAPTEPEVSPDAPVDNQKLTDPEFAPQEQPDVFFGPMPPPSQSIQTPKEKDFLNKASSNPYKSVSMSPLKDPTTKVFPEDTPNYVSGRLTDLTSRDNFNGAAKGTAVSLPPTTAATRFKTSNDMLSWVSALRKEKPEAFEALNKEVSQQYRGDWNSFYKAPDFDRNVRTIIGYDPFQAKPAVPTKPSAAKPVALAGAGLLAAEALTTGGDPRQKDPQQDAPTTPEATKPPRLISPFTGMPGALTPGPTLDAGGARTTPPENGKGTLVDPAFAGQQSARKSPNSKPTNAPDANVSTNQNASPSASSNPVTIEDIGLKQPKLADYGLDASVPAEKIEKARDALSKCKTGEGEEARVDVRSLYAQIEKVRAEMKTAYEKASDQYQKKQLAIGIASAVEMFGHAILAYKAAAYGEYKGVRADWASVRADLRDQYGTQLQQIKEDATGKMASLDDQIKTENQTQQDDKRFGQQKELAKDDQTFRATQQTDQQTFQASESNLSRKQEQWRVGEDGKLERWKTNENNATDLKKAGISAATSLSVAKLNYDAENRRTDATNAARGATGADNKMTIEEFRAASQAHKNVRLALAKAATPKGAKGEPTNPIPGFTQAAMQAAKGDPEIEKKIEALGKLKYNGNTLGFGADKEAITRQIGEISAAIDKKYDPDLILENKQSSSSLEAQPKPVASQKDQAFVTAYKSNPDAFYQRLSALEKANPSDYKTLLAEMDRLGIPRGAK